MNNASLELVSTEIAKALSGTLLGRIFPLSKRSLAIDFRLSDSNYLFITTEPASPAIYLISRKFKELERSSQCPQNFHLLLKKHLTGAVVGAVDKIPNERVIIIKFDATTEAGEAYSPALVAQLTGRSSNLFLLNSDRRIIGSLVDKDVAGQRIGETYHVPDRPLQPKTDDDAADIEIRPEDNGSASKALDRLFTERQANQNFNSRAETAKRAISREISKRMRLIDRLSEDLTNHGNAEKWKRYGDLLLANLSTARRQGDTVIVSDYFDEAAPELSIEADENMSLTDAAQSYFRRYTKATNAAVEIERRKSTIEKELSRLKAQLAELERAIEARDESYFAPSEPAKSARSVKKEKARFNGARQFMSSDGFEIYVGKKATDNDHLTFRVAGSLDTWLHAADYPGSHVIIRNPNRKDVPNRTLIEAAQLAAFYSSGKSQPKAAVHYTQKKFVNKPKGAAPGLVRLASFKTILVEPTIPAAIDRKLN